MTLIDLARLAARYWKLCVAIPLVCVLACGGYLAFKGNSVSYTASAYIVAASSAQLSALNGTASSAARNCSTLNPGYSANAKAETSSFTITVTATGPEADGAAAAANQVAQSALNQARTLLGEGNVSASVQEAVGAKRGSDRIVIYLLVALMAGLLFALCALVVIDAVRRPVKGSRDLSEASGLPVIGEVPGDAGERMLANARFASSPGKPGIILVVPVRDRNAAEVVRELIESATRAESPVDIERHGGPAAVSSCAPLQEDASAVYAAHEADAVIVAASRWGDSCRDVESAVAELRLAGANTVGCVLVEAAHNGKHGRRNTR